MTTLNSLGPILVINLERRKDRREHIKAQSENYSFDYSIVYAVDGNELTYIPNGLRPGEYALLLSHKNCLEIAKKNSFKQVVILEDDAEFTEFFNFRLDSDMEYIPNDWEVIYLGANHYRLGAGSIRPEVISKNIIRVFSSFCTHAMVINSSIYDLVINEIDNNPRPLDLIYVDVVQSRGKSYGFTPSLVKQIDSHSDIIGFCAGYNAMGVFQ